MADPTRCERDSNRWLTLGVGALMLAGLFSLIPLVGRMPVLGDLITDPLFARRCLVVHVNLALVVWLLAVLASLHARVPGRGDAAWPVRTAWAGIVLLLVSALMPGAVPVMSNYVPAIDHPAFCAGLVLLAAGLTSWLLDGRLLARQPAGDLPGAAIWGLRAAAFAWLMAMLTLLTALFTGPATTSAQVLYESLFWGGGHLMQFAHVAGMLTVWLILVSKAVGRCPVDDRLAAILFASLVLPLVHGPLLALLGTSSEASRLGFTRLMQYGIAPVVVAFAVFCVHALLRHRAFRLSDPAVAGFVASLALTVAGFVMGALVRGSNTVTPAHYHASIGGVTAAYMALALLALKVPVRLASLQPLLFAGGQLVFAVGFGLAGASGMLRKVYGAEQHIRNAQEWTGMALMGLGGLVAIAGGLLFLWLVARAWANQSTTRRPLWKTTLSRS